MQIENVDAKSEFFKALGEPNRLRIVEYLLKQGTCTCICELSKLLKRDQSVIFRHIQVLKRAGIVETRKEAKSLMCCISDVKLIRKLLEN